MRDILGVEDGQGDILLRAERDDVPAIYGLNSKVSNSLVADGCVIEGEVVNSVLFRGVHIAKGAVVKDSIVMKGGEISEGVELSYVVADKGVTVRPNRKMMGHATYPVAISKDTIV